MQLSDPAPRPASGPRSQPAACDADGTWLATQTVLYVEDDALTREFLGRFLRRRVGRLLLAADGVEGLQRFQVERPAIVITDVLKLTAELQLAASG